MEKVDVIDDYLNRQKRRVLYPQMGEMGLQLVPYTMYQIFEDGTDIVKGWKIKE